MGLNLNPIDAVKSAGKAIGDVANKGADAFGGVIDGAKKAASNMSLSDVGHLALDGVGMIPVVGEAADLANAGWYAAEGDMANAALSGAAAIPFAGNLATGVKWAKRGVEAVDAISDVAKTAKTIDKAVDAGKTAEKAVGAGKTAEKALDAGKTVEKTADAGKTAKRARTAETAEDAGAATKRAKTADNADDAGKASKADETSKVAPNATVTRTEGQNSFTWKTDSEGRFVSGKAKISEDFGGGKRPSAETDAQAAAAKKGVDGDQGGHMFAYRFTKGQGEINLVPQNANLNVGAWKKMENEWADWVNNGKQVNVETVAKRVDGADRPDTFRVSYEVTDPATGKVIYENSKRFENAAGETFDRIPAKDIKSWGAGG